MATLNQQLDNSKNLRKWRQIAAFNNGATNAMRNKMNEQVLFPGVHINTITGDTEFSGHGFNPLLPSFYTNPYTNAKGGSDYSSEDILKMTSQAYNNAKSGYLKQGMSEKEATKMAEKHAASVQQLYFSKAGKNNSAYDNFANAMSNGTMLPGAFNYGQYSTE
jgi:hypothetical protein